MRRHTLLVSDIRLGDFASGVKLPGDSLARCYIAFANKDSEVRHSDSLSSSCTVSGAQGGCHSMQYGDLSFELPDVPKDTAFVNIRFDIMAEPKGQGTGFQPMGSGTEAMFGEDGTNHLSAASAPDGVTCELPIEYINYLSTLMPWESPLQQVGKLSCVLRIEGPAVSCSGKSVSSHGSLNGAGKAGIIAAHRQHLNDEALMQEMRDMAKQAFMATFEMGKNGETLYRDLYRQTVPSCHMMLPCSHLAAHMQPAHCRVGAGCVLNLLLLGCHVCNTTPDQVRQKCWGGPEEVAQVINGVAKEAMQLWASGTKYATDTGARGEATERFLNLWGMYNALGDIGADSSRASGDCEDDAYSMVKMWVGLQHCDVDAAVSSYKQQHLSGGRSRGLPLGANVDYAGDAALFIQAVQHVARYYSCLPLTIASMAPNANDAAGSNEICTHTMAALIRNDLVTERIPGGDTWVCDAGSPAHSAIAIVPLEGTALVCRKGDAYDAAASRNYQGALVHQQADALLKAQSNSGEKTRFMRADSSCGFYYAVTEAHAPCGSYLVKRDGVFGVPFEDFLTSPSSVEYVRNHPALTAEQVAAAKHLALVECPVFELADVALPQALALYKHMDRLPSVAWEGGVFRGSHQGAWGDDAAASAASGAVFTDLSAALADAEQSSASAASAARGGDAAADGLYITQVALCRGVNLSLYGNVPLV